MADGILVLCGCRDMIRWWEKEGACWVEDNDRYRFQFPSCLYPKMLSRGCTVVHFLLGFFEQSWFLRSRISCNGCRLSITIFFRLPPILLWSHKETKMNVTKSFMDANLDESVFGRDMCRELQLLELCWKILRYWSWTRWAPNDDDDITF